MLRQEEKQLQTEGQESKPTLTRAPSPKKVISELSMIASVATQEEYKQIFDQLEKDGNHKILTSTNKEPKLQSVVHAMLESLNKNKGEVKENSSITKGPVKKSSSITDFRSLQASVAPKPAAPSILKLQKSVDTIIKSNQAKSLLGKPKKNTGFARSTSLDDLQEFKIDRYQKNQDSDSKDYSKHVHLGELAASLCEIEGQRWEQQDSLQYCKVTDDNKAYNAVYNYDQLTKLQRGEVLSEVIADMQERFGKYDPSSYSQSGGTTANATVAYVDHAGIAHITNANVGDSTSFYIILDEKNDLVDAKLINTSLHKPNDEAEHARIKKAGGFIRKWGCWRLDGSLAMSRALGDCEYEKSGLSHIPDIYQLEVPLKPGQKLVQLTACDGLTEKDLDTDGIAKIVSEHFKTGGTLKDLNQKLVGTAYTKGSGDNISSGACIHEIPKPEQEIQPQALVVFDGHGHTGATISNNMGQAFFPAVKKLIENKLGIENIEEQVQVKMLTH